MRVNPDHTSSLLSALQRITAEQSDVLGRLGSGKRIQKPSDDPAGIAALVQLQSSDQNTQQYVRNVTAVRSEIDLVHGFNTRSPSSERDTQGRLLPLGNCD